jgi:hypothetical protein
MGTYAGQIHGPDFGALLRALGPVLGRRLADSPFAGLSREVRVGLYRRTLALRFDSGRLTAVTDVGFTEGETVRFPPLQFIPLVLGYRSWEELAAVYPDVSIAPTARLLIETLFPRMTAFFYTVY